MKVLKGKGNSIRETVFDDDEVALKITYDNTGEMSLMAYYTLYRKGDENDIIVVLNEFEVKHLLDFVRKFQ